MKLLETIKELITETKSPKELQSEITVSEVWYLWSILIARYDVMRTTQLLKTFTDSKELEMIVEEGLEKLSKDTKELEKLMRKYGVTMPSKKPPKVSPITQNVEEVTDEYIFRRVFRGIQGFIPIQSKAFVSSGNPEIRDFFKDMLIRELELYDNFYEYGKMKGWIVTPPQYSPT